MKKADIQKQILDYLKLKKYLVFKHRNVGIFKQDTGKYIPLASGEKAKSDILGCTPQGRFLAIEVKMPKKKPSPEQAEFLDKVNQRGGIGFVAYSLDDVTKQGL